MQDVSSASGLKVKGYKENNGFIEEYIVDRTMCCLHALVEEARAGNIGEENVSGENTILGANAIMELRYHCNSGSPPLEINSKNFSPIKDSILSQRIRGNQDIIGDFLFGKGWKGKIENNQPLAIESPKVRAVIAAAHPRVEIRYNNPLDQNHPVSASRFKALAKQATRDIYNERQQAESGDSSTGFVSRPGAGWYNACAEESSIHIG